MSPSRPIAVIAALVITTSITACSDDEEPTGLPTPDPTTSAPPEPPPPTPTNEPTESDSAEVEELEALYLDYWEVITDLWNDPRIEVEPMLDVATDTRSETMMSYISSELIANDAHRSGEPQFSDITVAVDGDEAVIEACMDQSDWKLVADGTEVPIDMSEIKPAVATAVRQDDRWLIDETAIGMEEASIEC